MLDMLLDGFASLPPSGALDELLCDELKTMLFAGHDTSSAMLTWTLHALSGRAELWAKVREEADAVLPGGALPDYEGLKSLTYAQACLKEALRLYNIVPVVTRLVDKDDVAGGHELAAGTKVMLHLQAVHLDARHWPDPTRFDPERFLSGGGVGYRWLPFITGPRSCVGQHFSLLEAKIVVALLGQRYDFKPLPGNSDDRHRFHAPISPRTPIRMRLRRREGV
jgi:cytochrome P450